MKQTFDGVMNIVSYMISTLIHNLWINSCCLFRRSYISFGPNPAMTHTKCILWEPFSLYLRDDHEKASGLDVQSGWNPLSSPFPLRGSLSWFSVILAQPLGDCRVTGLAAGSRLAAMSERQTPAAFLHHFALTSNFIPSPHHLKGNQRLSEREKCINIFFFEKRSLFILQLDKMP